VRRDGTDVKLESDLRSGGGAEAGAERQVINNIILYQNIYYTI
jgi:hypothetical protein